MGVISRKWRSLRCTRDRCDDTNRGRGPKPFPSGRLEPCCRKTGGCTVLFRDRPEVRKNQKKLRVVTHEKPDPAELGTEDKIAEARQ